MDRLYIKGIYTFLGLHQETHSSCTCFPTCWRSIGPPLGRNDVLVEVEMFKMDDYICFMFSFGSAYHIFQKTQNTKHMFTHVYTFSRVSDFFWVYTCVSGFFGVYTCVSGFFWFTHV